jgi:hypothetical protein
VHPRTVPSARRRWRAQSITAPCPAPALGHDIMGLRPIVPDCLWNTYRSRRNDWLLGWFSFLAIRGLTRVQPIHRLNVWSTHLILVVSAMPTPREAVLKIAAKKVGLTLAEYLRRTRIGLKRCTRCKEWKKVEDFAADRSRYDGKSASCFRCNRVLIRGTTKGRPSTFLGRKHSEASKLLMSQAARGRTSKRTGQVHSEDARAKMRAAHQRRRAIRPSSSR